MKITPNTSTLGNLFNIPNEQFYIPAYQRRYAWGKPQLDAIFNDVNQLRENDSHLLGTILFLAESHTGGINRMEVVDGQQRLTTISIILKVILDKFNKTGNYQSNEVKKYLSCKTSGNSKNKIELGDLDEPDYKKIIEGNGLNKIENKNLLEAYDYFKEKIDALGEGVSDFYDKLVNRVEVIRLDMSEARDAYKLFETINNRGLRLSTTDIVKNFLLGHASLIDEKTLDLVKNHWKNMIVNLDIIDSDKFFRHFMMKKLMRKIPASKLIEEFKNYYFTNIVEAELLPDFRIHFQLQADNLQNDDEDDDENNKYSDLETESYADKKMTIVEFANVLEKNSQIYAKIINQKFSNLKINRYLSYLKMIESTPTFTFLLDLFQRDKVTDGEKIKTLKLLATFMIRRHICQSRTSEHDDIFSKLVAVEDKDIVVKIRKQLLMDLPSDKDFTEQFGKTQFKGLEERAKYILGKLEFKDQGEVDISREVELEHIIPQTINTKKSTKEFGDWIKYLGKNSQDKHKEYIWRIGNLTILGEKLNVVASNNPFQSKIREYKKSDFKINQTIAGYKKFKFGEVDKRSIELAEKAVKIWNFKNY
jgi:uncharacterized protein with ParB-like and HNH nuclease domain